MRTPDEHRALMREREETAALLAFLEAKAKELRGTLEEIDCLLHMRREIAPPDPARLWHMLRLAAGNRRSK